MADSRKRDPAVLRPAAMILPTGLFVAAPARAATTFSSTMVNQGSGNLRRSAQRFERGETSFLAC